MNVNLLRCKDVEGIPAPPPHNFFKIPSTSNKSAEEIEACSQGALNFPVRNRIYSFLHYYFVLIIQNYHESCIYKDYRNNIN